MRHDDRAEHQRMQEASIAARRKDLSFNGNKAENRCTQVNFEEPPQQQNSSGDTKNRHNNGIASGSGSGTIDDNPCSSFRTSAGLNGATNNYFYSKSKPVARYSFGANKDKDMKLRRDISISPIATSRSL